MNTTNNMPAPPPSKLTPLWLAARSHRLTYVLMSCGILLLDLLSGAFIMLTILFVVPVSLSAWFCSARFALGISILLTIGRVVIAAIVKHPFPLSYIIANALINLAVLCLMTLIASRASEASALRARVRVLEGILPICAFCKSIRDDKGNWIKMESYIANRSEAKFSHGVCPTCGQKHYGDILNSPENA